MQRLHHLDACAAILAPHAVTQVEEHVPLAAAHQLLHLRLQKPARACRTSECWSRLLHISLHFVRMQQRLQCAHAVGVPVGDARGCGGRGGLKIWVNPNAKHGGRVKARVGKEAGTGDSLGGMEVQGMHSNRHGTWSCCMLTTLTCFTALDLRSSTEPHSYLPSA